MIDINAVIDFERTSCSCAKCSAHCRRQPGMMGPGDEERMAQYLGVTDLTSALVAHLGTIRFMKGENQVLAIAVPTITPARKADGSCTFLTADGLCAVHPVSPMGCRYFDAHLTEAESDERTFPILFAIHADTDFQRRRDDLIRQGRDTARV